MDKMKCEHCGSEYFQEIKVSKYSPSPSSSMYFWPTGDLWVVYECSNPKCRRVVYPEIQSGLFSAEEHRKYKEFLDTIEGRVGETNRKS